MNAGVPLGAPASLYLMLYALKKEPSTPERSSGPPRRRVAQRRAVLPQRSPS